MCLKDQTEDNFMGEYDDVVFVYSAFEKEMNMVRMTQTCMIANLTNI